MREYVPVGELIPGMAYLVRRLLENTANESFLRLTFAQHEDVESLLVPPALKLAAEAGGRTGRRGGGRSGTASAERRRRDPERAPRSRTSPTPTSPAKPTAKP